MFTMLETQCWRPKVSSLKLLIAKFHIFRQKLDSKAPTFLAFMALLKEKLLVYKAAALANKTLQKFQTRWTTLLPLLDS